MNCFSRTRFVSCLCVIAAAVLAGYSFTSVPKSAPIDVLSDSDLSAIYGTDVPCDGDPCDGLQADNDTCKGGNGDCGLCKSAGLPDDQDPPNISCPATDRNYTNLGRNVCRPGGSGTCDELTATIRCWVVYACVQGDLVIGKLCDGTTNKCTVNPTVPNFNYACRTCTQGNLVDNSEETKPKYECN